jgi:WD40 repeat protein/transcriptional regulator with XRE-family HTH domain
MKQTNNHQQTTENIFGHSCTRIRHHLHLTKRELATLLALSPQTIQHWERGLSSPSRSHLIQLLTLALQRQAFPHGLEYQTAKQLWLAAHQQTDFDSFWIQIQHSTPHTLMVLKHETSPTDASQSPQASLPTPWHFDGGEAPNVRNFYGRYTQRRLLEQWVMQERCHLVCLLGMGGIGKSALAVSFMYQIAPTFQFVIFRSIRNAPPCLDLLADCLQTLSPQSLPTSPASVEHYITLLLQCFQTQRCLLILDNLEFLLQEQNPTGCYRPGYEDYALLLHTIAENSHQSCLLVTSRETPADLDQWELPLARVHTLHLAGLEPEDCEQLLLEHHLRGTTHDLAHLTQMYAGNPLALKIVAELVAELFGGEIAPFLEQNTTIFSTIRDLLTEQFARLSTTELALLTWLAIVREPISLTDLHSLFIPPISETLLAIALQALQRRSLVEQGKQHMTFTLQSVVLEYTTELLTNQVSQQIQQENPTSLICYALEQAEAKEYVRQAQECLIVTPIIIRLQTIYRQTNALKTHLFRLLDQFRGREEEAQGYGPANLMTLLRVLRGDLCRLDLSHLVIRGAYLQQIKMQDTTLAGTLIKESIFTQSFPSIVTVAISPNGQYWAATSRQGDVRVWRDTGQTLHLAWKPYANPIWGLAFSPNGQTLVTGSMNGQLKLWNMENGTLLWTTRLATNTHGLAFAPNGDMLATCGGTDMLVRIWSLQSDSEIQMLAHPSPLCSVAWSPDGRLIASGDFEGRIHIWNVETRQPILSMQTQERHNKWIPTLAFAPTGNMLASGSGDGTIKLWEVTSGHLLQTLTGHSNLIHTVIWSPDGCTLASGSRDRIIWLWDVKQKTYRAALQGHTAEIMSLAFTPDGHYLLSGGEDYSLRLWNVMRGQCVRVIQGYTGSLSSIDWSSDGTRLASGGLDTLVTIWDVSSQTPPLLLRKHYTPVYGVGWSPDGQWLASCGWESAIQLWNPTTGTYIEQQQGANDPETLFFGLAWSPNGQQLASLTLKQGVLIWNPSTQQYHWIHHPLPAWILHIAWHPDGTRLAGASDDRSLYLWDTSSNNKLLLQTQDHQGVITNLAWSPDGTRLASCGGNKERGELFVWNMQNGECTHVLSELASLISAVTWGPKGNLLISGNSDGVLRWWDIHSTTCIHVCQAHQGTVQALKLSPDGHTLASCGDDGAIMLWNLHTGQHLRTLRRDRPYERLDITGIQGLTEAQKTTLRTLGAIEHPSPPST